MKWVLLILGIVSVLILSGCSGVETKTLDDFAQCLTDNGAKMFGAYWCPHCTEQKAEFGKSWEKVTSVECSLPNRQGQTKACELAGITSYPTWEFADKSRLSGKLSLEQLSEKTGCPL